MRFSEPLPQKEPTLDGSWGKFLLDSIFRIEPGGTHKKMQRAGLNFQKFSHEGLFEGALLFFTVHLLRLLFGPAGREHAAWSGVDFPLKNKVEGLSPSTPRID